MGILDSLTKIRNDVSLQRYLELEKNFIELDTHNEGGKIFFKYQKSLKSCFLNSFYMGLAFLKKTEKIKFNPEDEGEKILNQWVEKNEFYKESQPNVQYEYIKKIFGNNPKKNAFVDLYPVYRDLLDVIGLTPDEIFIIMDIFEGKGFLPQYFYRSFQNDSIFSLKKEFSRDEFALIFGDNLHARLLLKRNNKCYLISSNHPVFRLLADEMGYENDKGDDVHVSEVVVSFEEPSGSLPGKLPLVCTINQILYGLPNKEERYNVEFAFMITPKK